jgi:Na+-translocating ferredoxin:NAD+ oxidoreductase RNF subunit RnfB
MSREAFLKQGLHALKHLGKDAFNSSVPSFLTTPLPQMPASAVACIELTECSAYRGSGCRVCFDVCPLPNIAITLTENLPQVLTEGCTGCNICVDNCPVPGAISLTMR